MMILMIADLLVYKLQISNIFITFSSNKFEFKACRIGQINVDVFDLIIFLWITLLFSYLSPQLY